MENKLALFDERYMEVMEAYAVLESQAKVIEEMKKKTRAELRDAMEEYGIKTIDNDVMKITLVAPSETTTIDVSSLKISEPDLFEQLLETFPKTTKRNASVRVTLK